MMKMMKRFAADQSGATAIEYGLLASLVAVAIITAATTLGNKIGATFNAVGNQIKTS